jgi:hypothetical protein
MKRNGSPAVRYVKFRTEAKRTYWLYAVEIDFGPLKARTRRGGDLGAPPAGVYLTARDAETGETYTRASPHDWWDLGKPLVAAHLHVRQAFADLPEHSILTEREAMAAVEPLIRRARAAREAASGGAAPNGAAA